MAASGAASTGAVAATDAGVELSTVSAGVVASGAGATFAAGAAASASRGACCVGSTGCAGSGCPGCFAAPRPWWWPPRRRAAFAPPGLRSPCAFCSPALSRRRRSPLRLALQQPTPPPLCASRPRPHRPLLAAPTRLLFRRFLPSCDAATSPAAGGVAVTASAAASSAPLPLGSGRCRRGGTRGGARTFAFAPCDLPVCALPSAPCPPVPCRSQGSARPPCLQTD